MLGAVLLHSGQTQRIIADVVLVVIPLGRFQRGSEISSQGIVQPGLCLFGSLCGGTGRAPARHQALFAFLCQRLQQRVLCKECLCLLPALCGGLHRLTLLCLAGCDLLFADADIAAHLLHGLAGGDHGDDALTGGGFDLILSHEVQRIAHGQIQAVAYQLHRHHAVFLGDVPGDILGQLHGDGNGRQVHKVHAQLHTQSVNELCLRDEAVLDQCVAQPLLGLLLERQSTLQLLLCDGPGRHQQIAQAHIGHFTHLPVKGSPSMDRGKPHSAYRHTCQGSDPVRL